MTAASPIYEAGATARQRHLFSIDTIRAGFAPMRAASVLRFFEFWAQRNCAGNWRVEESRTQIVLSVDLDRDAVMFRLSEFFDLFNDVMEAPVPPPLRGNGQAA